MENFSINVNKIECNDFHIDEEIRNTLHKFYLQLKLQPVMFTAFGFYKINLALLASVTTGVISYQIILVQFHQPAEGINANNITIDNVLFV